jgi:hypothetical protein
MPSTALVSCRVSFAEGGWTLSTPMRDPLESTIGKMAPGFSSME